MINPFDCVPFNTERVFVSGLTHHGCRLYLPIYCTDERVIARKKKQLEEWLVDQHAYQIVKERKENA